MHRFTDNVGWQSWSVTPTNSPIKFPRNRFPFRKTDGPTSKTSISKRISIKSPVTGWCSWPHYGNSVTEKDILRQVNWLSENTDVALDYILLDDGWATWGDWLSPDVSKFPNGLRDLNREIEKFGFRPGIWIAPFLVHPKSFLARENPEWLVKRNGKPIDGLKAFAKDSFSPIKRYLLDIANVDAVEYLDAVFYKLFDEFGFKLVKLDFLYAYHFNPTVSHEDADKILRGFLKRFREKYPEIYSIACGCPLEPAAGVVDSCRIAPDNSVYPLIPKRLRFLNPVVKRVYRSFYLWALRSNYKKRAWTRDFWNLDLDTFVCDSRHGFSKEDLEFLRDKIKISKANTFLGDDLTQLTQHQIDLHIKPLLS